VASKTSDCKHANKIQSTNKVINPIGNVFGSYGEAYIKAYKADLGKIKLIRNIRKCRTPALGSIIVTCKGCGHSTKIYKSCGDGKCPICQSIKRMQVQDKIAKKLLNVPYMHVTFTLPHQLNGLLKRNKKVLYNLLYQSAWQSIKSLTAQKNNVGALPGMIAIMHSWGADMKYHVHLHSLITFGGLDQLGQWQYPKRKDKIAPYRKINAEFKSSYLKEIKKLDKKQQLIKAPFFEQTIAEVEKLNWVVNNGLPQSNTDNIEEYLSRYVMKIAVSNSRISLDEVKQQVYLIHNDYKNQIKGKPAPKKIKVFNPLTFIHQFLMHLPPKYFQRMRYYGIHSSTTYKKIKDSINQKLLRNKKTVRSIIQIINGLLKVEIIACKQCGGLAFEKHTQAADYNWLQKNIPGYKNKAPPKTNKIWKSIWKQ